MLVCCSVDDFNEGLILPTLIRQLKSILDQYPDDGQIFKVGFLHIFVPYRPNIYSTFFGNKRVPVRRIGAYIVKSTEYTNKTLMHHRMWVGFTQGDGLGWTELGLVRFCAKN